VEAPRLEINAFIKEHDKEIVCFGQGTQIGKYSSRALEAPRLEINTFRKIIDRYKMCFGQGIQIGKCNSRLTKIELCREQIGFRHGIWIGKSNSRGLEPPRLETKTFARRIDKTHIGFGKGT